MKKLLVLAVLLGLMALPMFASDFTFGGDFTYGYITTFDGKQFGNEIDYSLDIIAKVDEFNTFTVNIDGLERNIVDIITDLVALKVPTIVGLGKASVATDIGKWLGLPVGTVLTWGYDEYDAYETSTFTNYETENFWDATPIDNWGLSLVVTPIPMVNVRVDVESRTALAIGAIPIPMATAVEGRVAAGLAVVEPIKGLNAEAYFNVPKYDFNAFQLLIDGSYATEISDITLKAGLAFMYDFLKDAPYKWGAALKGGWKMLTLLVGATGLKDDMFSKLSAELDVALFDKLDVYGGGVFSFTSGTDLFQAADLGVKLKMGATSCYVGYLVTSVGGTHLNAPQSPTDGGFYFKFDMNY